jgi:hypothetical protein
VPPPVCWGWGERSGVNASVVPPAMMVRTAGGRVAAALNTLYVLSAVGAEGKKGVIVVIHHTGMFSWSFGLALKRGSGREF